MTFTVDADTSSEEIERRLGASVDRETVRTGSARESRLRRNARRQARDWDATLSIVENHPTAHVEAEPGEAPHIVVTGREVEQPVTDYNGKAWDWIVQRSFGVHEVGHIRYSDIDHKDDCLEAFEPGDRGTVHSLWNALEDGAIEKQIIGRWPNFEAPLRALRANLFDDFAPGLEDQEDGGYVYPIPHAVHGVLMDLWMRDVYGIDVGFVEQLIDPENHQHHFAFSEDRRLFLREAFPLCVDVVPRVLSEPDARERNTVIMDFAEEIIDLMDRSKADGRTQKNGEGSHNQTPDGMPDDSRHNHSGGQQATADELGEVDAEDVEIEAAGGAGGTPTDEDMDAEPTDAAAGDDLTAPSDVETDADLSSKATEETTDDAREEIGSGADVAEELQELADALGASDEFEGDGIEFPTGEFGENAETRAASERAATGLAQVLKQRLLAQRKSETKQNQRRGRYTGRGGAGRRAAMGDRRVKQRDEDPEEKDYHCTIVLDRSGSMGGARITAAETAAGMLCLALEEVGVDVMLIELYSSRARLSKPFGVNTTDRASNVWHGQVSGGTPLTEVLRLARARLNREGGNRFMFVVTDGRPGNASTFEAELSKCTFPVLGVTIGDGSAGKQHYHREVAADATDDLQETLRGLLMEVLF